MRFRISDAEVQYYAQAKRDNTTVRVHGQNWRVLGVTADLMGGVINDGLAASGRQAQWWIELSEVH